MAILVYYNNNGFVCRYRSTYYYGNDACRYRSTYYYACSSY